jgi:hypothetical protein
MVALSVLEKIEFYPSPLPLQSGAEEDQIEKII